MGKVSATGDVSIPNDRSGFVGESHGGQSALAPEGTATSFSASYALALQKASAYGGAATSGAGHAHTMAAATPGSPSNATSGIHASSSAKASGHAALTAQQGHGSGRHDLHERALGLRAYRMQLLASNIANADTPGYKAVDIDFQEALRSVTQTASMKLATTATGHISAPTGSPFPSIALKYHVPAQPSADGNTVEMDVERGKFMENALMYEFSLDQAIGHYKHMAEMIKNLKD